MILITMKNQEFELCNELFQTNLIVKKDRKKLNFKLRENLSFVLRFVRQHRFTTIILSIKIKNLI